MSRGRFQTQSCVLSSHSQCQPTSSQSHSSNPRHIQIKIYRQAKIMYQICHHANIRRFEVNVDICQSDRDLGYHAKFKVQKNAIGPRRQRPPRVYPQPLRRPDNSRKVCRTRCLSFCCMYTPGRLISCFIMSFQITRCFFFNV